MTLKLPLVVLALAALAAPGRAAPPPTLAPSELHAGQKAVVRTVFAGSRIEEFDAEIVGVFRGGRTQGDMILGRATTERVIKMGIAQGMSGSPVYVDGKLIGALSSGWPYSREPLFGITPIGEMLDVLSLPDRDSGEGAVGPTGVDASRRSTSMSTSFRGLHWDDGADGGVDARTNATPSPEPASAPSMTALASRLVPLRLPIACGGLNPALLGPLSTILEPYGLAAVPGGRSVPRRAPKTAIAAAADSIAPGSAVGVVIMRGDLDFAAIGTVTYRDGDRVLIFGHPFFQAGDVRLPLAAAEITTIVASDLFSFKLGTTGDAIGTVTQDRRPAVGGRLGASPSLMPFGVTVTRRGDPPQRFRFEAIEDRSMAPSLVGFAATNSLLESGGTAASQTLRWSLTLHRHAGPSLTLSDVEAGDAPVNDVAGGIAGPLAFLYNNPYGRLALDSVSVTVDVVPGREQWTLRSARLLEAAVRPGGSVTVRCEVERWRGPVEVREFSVRVPEELPDGRYTLWLGGGGELTRYEASHLPGRFRITSVEDGWRRLAATRASNGLFASLFARAPEVSVEGRDYPELPLSALVLIASDQSAGDRSRRGDVAKLDEQRLGLDGLVRGELQLGLIVDSKAP